MMPALSGECASDEHAWCDDGGPDGTCGCECHGFIDDDPDQEA